MGENAYDWDPRYVRETLEDTQWKIRRAERTAGFFDVLAHGEGRADDGSWYTSGEFEIVGYKYLTSAGARHRPKWGGMGVVGLVFFAMRMVW